MSGMTVRGESDGDLCGICGGKAGNMVRNVVIVSQHKSVVSVSTKNK